MMKAELLYWSQIKPPLQWESEVKRREEIEGSTEIEIFETFYKKNNELRYCNGTYYTFAGKAWEEKYKTWLSSDDYKKKSFDLYYGPNGIVD